MPEWKASLPEEIRGEASLATIHTIESLAKGYVHAQRMVGAEKVVIPKADAPDEEWAGVFDRLGRPESPDKYEFTKPEEMPEGLGYSEEIEKAFREKAHKLGLTAKQAAELYKWRLEADISSYNQIAQDHVQQVEATVAELKKEYGKAFESSVESGYRAIKKIAPPELMEMVETGGLGNNKAFIKFAINLSKAMGEDGIRSGASTIPTPADAQQAIARVMGDRGHAYHDRSHPEHDIAVKKMAELYQAAYPTEDTGQRQ
jgi:hypothetical protein